MTSNGFHSDWPQNYAHGDFQRNTHGQASSQSCNQVNSHAASNISPLPAGYVHSGYQAAIQGNSLNVNQALQPDFHPQYRPFMQNGTNYVPNIFARPPRLGPGGPVRCSYPGCEYSGYAKGVEIHKMDRHLLFPPGYKPPKSAPDADVGPNVTIPGTGISLNTPEAIETWLAERKKNWPTASRIAEKQKRKAEAIERGELEHTSNKRPRINASSSFNDNRSYSRDRDRGRGVLRGYRGRGRGRGAGFVQSETHAPGSIEGPVSCQAFPLPPKPNETMVQGQAEGDLHSSSDSDSASGSDIDPIRDVISSKVQPKDYQEMDEGPEQPQARVTDVVIKAHKKKQQRNPAPKTYNPLVVRPSFLRKLLQPEIKHTISNLSQAIRFIVDNDMFHGVELKPGDAENILIKEVEPTESNDAGWDTSPS